MFLAKKRSQREWVVILETLQSHNVDHVADRDDDDGDDDGSHVEGLQFLAERDMKSLHRVSDL